MQVELPRGGIPAGVTIAANPEGATISVWAGSREMIAHLDAARLAEAARILSAQHGHMQITGTVREFIAPAIA
jgi:hypothetical protein